MRITDLQLHNFKFFTESNNTLKLDGKNVLIWGENGSGKSSIYWAIYTLLQCSFKNAKGIDDYFTDSHDKNLINIHREEDDTSSFVEMKLDNGKTYKIELGDHSVIGDKDIQLSTISSDFIDYKVVASFLNFWHRDEPKIFKIFEESIFNFLSFSPPKPYKFEFFNLAWMELSKEFDKDLVTKRYPSKGSPTYQNKENLAKAFNSQLRILLGEVTTIANELLKNIFRYDIEIELEYAPYEFNVYNQNWKAAYKMPEIYLRIRSYDGQADKVKRPHSFLNEAKKTAIGLAIRLGILKRRLLADKLNLLALDDLLISLDMSNRDIVLDLLFNDYQEDYQQIIFTHDKQFYNIAKHKIEHSSFKDNWLFWEFYVNEKDPKKPKPKWFAAKSQLSIAIGHLQENDYPAAANYLRKHCEHLIETYLPQYCHVRPDSEKPNAVQPLNSMIENTVKFLERINQTDAVSTANNLKQFIELMLNPLSHTERGVPRHKGEIKKVIDLLEEFENELKKIKLKKTPILPKNTELFLTLVKDADNTFRIKVKLRDDLFVYDDNGTVTLSKCLTDSVDYCHSQPGQDDITGDFRFPQYQNKELKKSYEDITVHDRIDVPVIADWEKLYTLSDGSLLTDKMTL